MLELTSQELDGLKTQLQEILASNRPDLTDLKEQISLPKYLDDVGPETFQKELTITEKAPEEERRRQAYQALQRMRRGVYGTCLGCSGHIHKTRLIRSPWVPLCIQCQEAKEANGGVLPASEAASSPQSADSAEPMMAASAPVVFMVRMNVEVNGKTHWARPNAKKVPKIRTHRRR